MAIAVIPVNPINADATILTWTRLAFVDICLAVFAREAQAALAGRNLCKNVKLGETIIRPIHFGVVFG